MAYKKISGIQDKLIHRFKEYFSLTLNNHDIDGNNIILYYGNDEVMIVAYDGLILYDSKRGIDIR